MLSKDEYYLTVKTMGLVLWIQCHPQPVQTVATQATEDSSSANTSDSSMPGPYRFEKSEFDPRAWETSSDDDNSVHEGLTDLSL